MSTDQYRIHYHGSNHGKTLMQAWDIARHLQGFMKGRDLNVTIEVKSVELSELERENAKLREENEILKKVYMAKREEPPKPGTTATDIANRALLALANFDERPMPIGFDYASMERKFIPTWAEFQAKSRSDRPRVFPKITYFDSFDAMAYMNKMIESPPKSMTATEARERSQPTKKDWRK
jgi:hypothetical protein